MTRVSEAAAHWLGLCRKAPVFHAAPALMLFGPGTAHAARPGGSGSDPGPGRVRHGIGIATASIRTLFREKHLLWFLLLAGLVLVFLFAAEGWSVTHTDSLPLLSSIWIPSGNSGLILFSMRLFLIEAVCISCFTGLLAAVVLERNAARTTVPVTIRKACAGAVAHAFPLAALSVLMAVAATVAFELLSQSQFLGRIIFSLDMAFFNLPYAYYVPAGISAMYYFSFKIMAINILLFLLALYVVPGMVLEGKGLPTALAGAVTLMKKTWRELVGCTLVLGAIVLCTGAAGLLIGQSPQLLNHDYDFFLQLSRGQVLMTVACYGFLLTCFLLMAAGYTTAGVAVSDLYHVGKSEGLSGTPDGSMKKTEHAS